MTMVSPTENIVMLTKEASVFMNEQKLYRTDSSYLGMTMVSPTEKIWQVDLFPNPATDEINIVSGNQTEEISVLIVDVTGKQLLKTQVSTKNFVANVKLNLLNGIYFITLKNANNEAAVKKLVINK